MLTPEFRTKLHQLRIQCRPPFHGRCRGDRRSRNRGTGIEFADYRLYQHGDDLRHLDWNVYARLEKLFIKMSQATAALPISILIDTSHSMQFGEPTKLQYAKQLTAALSYIALANADPVTLYNFAERLTTTLPPNYRNPAQYISIQKALAPLKASGTTHIAKCLTQLATHPAQRGVVIVISDFLDAIGYTKGVNSLLGHGCILTLIHLQAPEEIEPPPIGTWCLEDVETGETQEITINAETITHYHYQHKKFCEHLQNYCTKQGVGYIQIRTDTDYESVIMQDMQHAGFLQRRY